MGRLCSFTTHCVEATEWELHREGVEGFSRQAGRAYLAEVFGDYPILTLADATGAVKALSKYQRSLRELWEWVAGRGMVTPRDVSRALYRYHGPGGSARATADLEDLLDDGVLEAVARRGRHVPATVAYRVVGGVGVPDLLRRLEEERAAFEQWIKVRKQRGPSRGNPHVRRRTGIYYAKALVHAIDILRVVGVPLVEAEAVGATWHGGFFRLSGEVSILSPNSPADNLRRAVGDRLFQAGLFPVTSSPSSRSNRVPHARATDDDFSEYDDLVVEFLDITLAAMRPETHGQ